MSTVTAALRRRSARGSGGSTRGRSAGSSQAAGRRPAERTAAVVERLAVLLAGGTTPLSAWAHVAALAAREAEGADGGRDGSLAAFARTLSSALEALRARRTPSSDSASDASPELRVARRLRAGHGVSDALAAERDDAWRILGCAWALAERTGAPLSRSLAELADGFRDVGLAEREVAVALEGPVATSRLVSALPLAGLGLGALLGLDSLGTLLGTPFGLACLVLGLALMAMGAAWSRRLVRSASRRAPHPGLELDLAALALLGGSPPGEARTAVRAALERFELEAEDGERLEEVLALATAAGVPASTLLRSEARLARRDARTAAQARAARLGVELMLPLGACVLPAFLCLGVAPLVLSVIGSTLGAR
ncbi:hypothetical protein USB125703_00950 [Pseudoclavibacter triregionum]|nr:hypothetical protein USB125703_00950 [Pseudoclavibacter triregionum]